MNWFFFRFFFFFGLYLLVSCVAAAKSTFTLGVAADWKRDDFCTYFACREQNWYVRDEKLIRQPPRTWDPAPLAEFAATIAAKVGRFLIDGRRLSLLKIYVTLSKIATWFDKVRNTSLKFGTFFSGSNEPFTMFSVWLDLDSMLLKMRYSNCQLTTRNECPSKEPLLTLCCDVESSCHLPKVILSKFHRPQATFQQFWKIPTFDPVSQF